MGFEEQSGGTKIKTLVVVDAGVATRDNLAMLKEAGFSYLVNDTRSNRSRYHEQFNDREKFRRLTGRNTERQKAPVEVRMLREPAFDAKDRSTPDQDTILLCRSQGREQKEDAMFSKAEERFLKKARKLDRRLKCGRLTRIEKIHEAIGRLKAQNSRVQRFYTIELRNQSTPREGLLFECKEGEIEGHRQLFGCYILRTDREDFEPEELWRAYIGLTQAEEGFRALKTDLGLRPNFHQKEQRVDGHIFITVIAFHLWRWIRHKLDSAGDNRDWVTVRRVLRTHCYATLVVPCEEDRVYHIRKPGRPEEQQRQIYQGFGVNISNLINSTLEFSKNDQN